MPGDVFRSVVWKISEPPNVHCEWCLIRSAGFLIWLPYRLVRRRPYVGSDWLPVRWVGCVNCLVVVYACLKRYRIGIRTYEKAIYCVVKMISVLFLE